jgi:glycyl-tRNA synthetase
MSEKNQPTMEEIVSLCKRRGFVFPSSEIYGGLANAWDFGPYGSQLKKNIKDSWWRFFVERRDDMVGLDAAIIMNPRTWEASGHLSHFSDLKAECKKCNERIRVDQKLKDEDNAYFNDKVKNINDAIRNGEKTAIGSEDEIDGIRKEMQIKLNEYCACSKCGNKNWTVPEQFNLMFRIDYSLTGSENSIAYLRPETAQAMFVDFLNISNTARKKLPFGVAQIGKSFRNEITPGNFIFRTREFEQMEIEYFFDSKKSDWNIPFDGLRKDMEKWMDAVGIDMKKVHAVDIPDGERAHYSQRTIDFEFEYPFGQKELFGLAYRGDYDLSQHENLSGEELRIIDPETNEKIRPHVIEPSLGVERGLLSVLLSAFENQVLEDGSSRTVLHFKPEIAPVQIAVFPLMKNKEELVEKAKNIFEDLKQNFRCEFDDNGNVGKRYRRQDEIGTPFCVTVDFESLEDGAVTVRDRDTMVQERIKIADLQKYFGEKLK